MNDQIRPVGRLEFVLSFLLWYPSGNKDFFVCVCECVCVLCIYKEVAIQYTCYLVEQVHKMTMTNMSHPVKLLVTNKMSVKKKAPLIRTVI